MFERQSRIAYYPNSLWKIRSFRKLVEVIDQRYSGVSIAFLIIFLLMELASVALYVWTSLATPTTSLLNFQWGDAVFVVEVVLNVFFFLEWAVLLFGEEEKTRYCFSWLSLVNAITSIPMVVLGFGTLFNSSYRNFWVPMYLRVWWLRDCVLILLDYPQVAHCMVDITRDIFRFLTTLIAVMCTCVGTYQIMESGFGNYVDLYVSLYLIVTTFTTIGFGDVAPLSTPTRLLLMFFAVIGISYFLPFFRKLALIGREHLYYNVYNSHGGRMPHVIIAGVFTEVGVDIILRNFYGCWRRCLDLRIVLLSPVEHPPGVKLLVNLPWFKDRVVLMIGNPEKESDLKRADAHHADAIFLFGDTGSAASHTDYHLIRQSLFIDQYNDGLAQYLFLRSERHTKHVASYAAGVVEGERLLHHLLGLGAAVPGAIPLVLNLLGTYEPLPLDMTRSRHWVEQYEWSLRNDICCVEIDEAFHGCNFYNLARLFLELNVAPIGVVHVGGRVELSPSHISSSARKVIVIARNLQTANDSVKKVGEGLCRISEASNFPRKPDKSCVAAKRRTANNSTVLPSTVGSRRVEALQQVENAYDFENHFVVIDISMTKARAVETEGAREGSLTSAAADVYHVMRSIRQCYPQNDIVFLTKDISFLVYFEQHWNNFRSPIPVRHIEGCGLHTRDLRRCNLKHSAGIVIFISGDISGPSTSGLSMLVDLSITSIIQSSHNIPVVVELDSLQHLSLFPPYAEDDRLRKKAELDFVFEPNYIIGNAISRHMLFPLLHRAYFMREVIDIIDLLVSGVDEETPSLGRLSLSLTSERIETYEDVVDYCLMLCYVPIGLHRCIVDTREMSLNGQRFVITNPPMSLAVDRETDSVFYVLPT